MQPRIYTGRIVFTIGHSNHSIEAFISLLERAGITAIADVRSVPFSRRFSHFNRPELVRSLRKTGIAYVFLGNQLGARPKDRDCYVDGRVDYERIAMTSEFREGLRRIEDGAERYRISIMCAEREPLDCHRTILVARHLRTRGVDVRHILANGSIEPHCETERRLLDLVGNTAADLFHLAEPVHDRLSEAYTRRGREIAYVESRSEAAASDTAEDRP